MKIQRAASIPLILHDPYFSIWSSSDALNASDPVHWSGARQKLRGYLMIGDERYCFLGDPELHSVIPQTDLDVTPTSTAYTFENHRARMTVRFTSPLLLDDPVLVSRPCTYVDCTVETKNGEAAGVALTASAELVEAQPAPVRGSACIRGGMAYACMGKAKQTPLGHSGDHVTIDWGFLYLAGDKDGVRAEFDPANASLTARAELPGGGGAAHFVVAYDDLCSINYFGEWRRAYWTKAYGGILDAIAASLEDREEVLRACGREDESLLREAEKAGGEDYAFLCCMSYRHAVAAHKLIEDEEGNLIFLSKENDSNGCIGTVDVSYPSVPLFLLHGTEYVKGMLRPIFRFAACDVWEYDFAPHDVGRYPYATGQVYGQNPAYSKVRFLREEGEVYPFYFQYPCGSEAYDLSRQMPLEECGNMLILTAECCLLDGRGSFAEPHYETLKKWARYLADFGADPENQLCTDDFAGHLSHNVNLSAKAVLGVEAFAQIAGLLDRRSEAEKYHALAREMARGWEERASAGDHYSLVFGDPESWSLKYNLVWDRLWGTHLFSDEVYEKELAFYLTRRNSFGVPLDSRADYTKSDWLLWCAAMAEGETRKAMLAPVARYLRETSTRVPFSDWYDTVTGRYCRFIARSVQGGIFMPLLRSAGENSQR